jgi:hypothetical protein
MKLFRWSVAAAVCVAVFGCSEATSPRSSSVLGGNLVRLTVSLSAGEVTRGTPVTLHVKLVNEGGSTVTLHFNDACQVNPYIQDRTGKTVLPNDGGWACAAVLTDLTLQPGRGIDRDYVWTGSTDFSSEMPLRLLPPGRYFFSAEVPANETILRATVELLLK